MSKRFLLILLALFLLMVGGIWFAKSKQKASEPPSGSAVSNHVNGKGNKKVTFVEYGDFQCPACGQYYPIIEQVRKKFGDDITFQFRNFPLVQIHPNAMAAHRAAEAADKQGKFWEMYNLLYARQQDWVSAGSAGKIMEGFAEELGINADQFKKDVASSQTNDAINADIKAGQALGVSSTPTFFINNKKIDKSPQDVEGFNKLIQEAIDLQK